MNNKNIFSTTHLHLAVILSMYYPLEAVDRSNKDKAKFLFRHKNGLDEIVQSFWKQELQVEPVAFFQQIKIVKSRLYE